MDTVAPFAEKFVVFMTWFLEKCPVQILTCFLGISLCFFGGSFMWTIAAAEAFYCSGWETTKKAMLILWNEYKAFSEISKEDDKRDDDGDGIPDVQQIDAKALLSRKIGLFLINCKDPNQVNVAIGGIWASSLAVLATLKVQFARTVALGVSIGVMLKKPAESFLAPALRRVLPSDYHKWIQLMIDWTCKLIAITIACFIQRVITAVQSGIRGGLMATRSLLAFLQKRGFINFSDEDTNIDEIGGWLLAGLGIWFQLSHFFALPFPWNIILLPLRMIEFGLQWVVME